MGEFRIESNRFLVFEEGPSVDVMLQWATYQDASDQSSLSRLWGGIHPPVDDIPARLIGVQVGEDAFALSEAYFGQPLPWAPDAPAVTGSSAISVAVNWEALPTAITSYDLRYRQGDSSGLYGRSAGCDRDECDYHWAKAQYRIRGTGEGEQCDRRWRLVARGCW